MTVVDAAAVTAAGDAGQSDVQVDAAQSDVPVDRGSTGPADASTDGGGSCFPACIVDLGIPCSRTGQACVQMASATEAVSCFANGVKSRTADGGTVVKKANGEICLRIVQRVVPLGRRYPNPTTAAIAPDWSDPDLHVPTDQLAEEDSSATDGVSAFLIQSVRSALKKRSLRTGR